MMVTAPQERGMISFNQIRKFMTASLLHMHHYPNHTGRQKAIQISFPWNACKYKTHNISFRFLEWIKDLFQKDAVGVLAELVIQEKSMFLVSALFFLGRIKNMVGRDGRSRRKCTYFPSVLLGRTDVGDKQKDVGSSQLSSSLSPSVKVGQGYSGKGRTSINRVRCKGCTQSTDGSERVQNILFRSGDDFGGETFDLWLWRENEHQVRTEFRVVMLHRGGSVYTVTCWCFIFRLNNPLHILTSSK